MREIIQVYVDEDKKNKEGERKRENINLLFIN